MREFLRESNVGVGVRYWVCVCVYGGVIKEREEVFELFRSGKKNMRMVTGE